MKTKMALNKREVELLARHYLRIARSKQGAYKLLARMQECNPYRHYEVMYARSPLTGKYAFYIIERLTQPPINRAEDDLTKFFRAKWYCPKCQINEIAELDK